MKSLISLSFETMMKTALLVLSVVFVTSASTASAQTPTVFRGIRVDMSGIPSGARQTREDLQVCLSLNLPKAFAGRINPAAQGAPVLIVRPTSVWLAPMATGLGSDEWGKSESNVGFDSMEGEAIIGNRRVPLTVSASAPSFIALPLDAARQRSITLCNSFVGWLARKI